MKYTTHNPKIDDYKELVKRTSLYLMKLSEQSQQKIVNLTAENQ